VSEVRTTSSTGGEKGVKAQRHDLLPRPALDAIAEVYAFGAQKYADHNWRRGYEWGKSYAALQRHLTAWWDGEDLDPESGLSHLGHAGFHVFALLTWMAEQGSGVENVFDDRWPHGMARRDADVAEVAEEPRSWGGVFTQVGVMPESGFTMAGPPRIRICMECGNDEVCEGYKHCSECLEKTT
jgi:hypothetical protein